MRGRKREPGTYGLRMVGDDPLAGDVTSLAFLALRKHSSHHQ